MFDPAVTHPCICAGSPGSNWNIVGAYFSICSAGKYLAPTSPGGCRTRKAVGCTSPPTSDLGPTANNWPDWCAGAEDGDTCWASCVNAGYDEYEGGFVAVCMGDNVWSAPVGSCKRSAFKCYRGPPNPPLPNNTYDW